MKSITFTSRHLTPLTYFKKGQGPAIVIANAYGVATRFWDGVIEALAPTYTILIWELRGIEDADKPSADFSFSVDEHSEDLNEILANECLNSVHCVAWCSGAKVALRFQHDYPGVIKSLIFVSGNFSPFAKNPAFQSEWDEKMLAATNLLIQNPAAKPFFFDAVKTAIDAVMRGDNNIQGGRFGLLKMIRAEYINLMLQPMFNEATMINYLGLINAYYHYDVSSLLEDLHIPQCFLWSDEDHISSPDQSRLLSRANNNAEGISVPDSNHYMIIEKPDTVAGYVDAFITKHS